MSLPGRFDLLFEKYVDQALSPAERAELRGLVRDQPECQAALVACLVQECAIREQARAAAPISRRRSSHQRLPRARILPLLAGLAAAALVVFALALGWELSKPMARLGVAVAATIDGRPAQAGDRLRPGARLRVAPAGRAVVILPVGAAVELSSGDLSLADARGARIELGGGRLDATVEHQEHGHLSVATAEAELTVVGTRFTVEAGSGGTGLRVAEGVVRFVDRHGQDLLVGAGDRAWSLGGGADGRGVGRPTWADAMGQDGQGTWARLSVNGATQRFRWIRPGSFGMGCDQAEAQWAFDEVKEPMRQQQLTLGTFAVAVPRHRVLIGRGFWLADTPCTQELWSAVMGRNPSRFTGDPRRPVEQVSWEDCRDFFIRLHGLVPGLEAGFPSEAQWEYACRAGTATRWWWGDDPAAYSRYADLADQSILGSPEEMPKAWAMAGDDGFPETAPVGSFAPNPWGLYDMGGNVWQWCADWFAPYRAGEGQDPAGPDHGDQRVNRGGSWFCPVARARAADRLGSPPAATRADLGLRLCIPERLTR